MSLFLHLLLSLAPTLFAFSIHLAFAKVVKFVQGQHSKSMEMDKLTKLLAVGYLISILFQVQEACFEMQVTHGQLINSGLLGTWNLLLQIGLLGVSAAAAVDFRKRTRVSSTTPLSTTQIVWRNDVGMLCSVGTLVLVRLVFRLFEQMVNDEVERPLQSIKTYIFDGNMMLGALIFFYHHYPVSHNIASEAEVGARIEKSG
jgi:hypothetical protein